MFFSGKRFAISVYIFTCRFYAVSLFFTSLVDLTFFGRLPVA